MKELNQNYEMFEKRGGALRPNKDSSAQVSSPENSQLKIPGEGDVSTNNAKSLTRGNFTIVKKNTVRDSLESSNANATQSLFQPTTAGNQTGEATVENSFEKSTEGDQKQLQEDNLQEQSLDVEGDLMNER